MVAANAEQVGVVQFLAEPLAVAEHLKLIVLFCKRLLQLIENPFLVFKFLTVFQF